MRRRTKKALKIVAIVLVCIVAAYGIITLVGVIGAQANLKRIETYEVVGSPIKPYIDETTGVWTFKTDEDFRIVQITDIHIGAGAFSIAKDGWALDAVYTMLARLEPDLVVVTGDIAYPIPFQAGTINNMREAKMFAALMNRLDVYWTFVFGNHDTEIYSYYDRDQIADFYMQQPKCLFSKGPEGVDGVGNYAINIVGSDNAIRRSLIMLDSHAYVEGAIAFQYDKIHDNQIEWYRRTITEMNAYNVALTGNADAVVPSLMFMHIPLTEYDDAWKAYRAAGSKDTDEVKYLYGQAGEDGEIVCHGEERSALFDVVLELGSTDGIFCGHDHLNTWALNYKGVQLTYGMSIDYLAYFGIADQVEQRGATTIDLKADGTFASQNHTLL